MNIRAIRTSTFTEGADLSVFIRKHIPKLKNGSILAVTSKVVALAEGAVVRTANPRAKEALIRAESEWQLRARRGKIKLRGGLLMWDGGGH